MTPYQVQLTQAAPKDVDRLSQPTQDRIVLALQGLMDNPLEAPPKVKRLKGFSFPIFRIRTGDFRILYRIDKQTVTVMRIINRKDLEKVVRQLQ